MTDTRNGVVQKSDMKLIKAGFCDFTQDGSFDPETQEQHGDLFDDYHLLSNPFMPDDPYVTIWNETTWENIAR